MDGYSYGDLRRVLRHEFLCRASISGDEGDHRGRWVRPRALHTCRGLP